jgi:hypothetical protein
MSKRTRDEIEAIDTALGLSHSDASGGLVDKRRRRALQSASDLVGAVPLSVGRPASTSVSGHPKHPHLANTCRRFHGAVSAAMRCR